MNTSTLSASWIVILILIAVWELIWKTLAMWQASERDQKTWFVILLIINSAGILPILYLLFTSDKKAPRTPA